MCIPNFEQYSYNTCRMDKANSWYRSSEVEHHFYVNRNNMLSKKIKQVAVSTKRSQNRLGMRLWRMIIWSLENWRFLMHWTDRKCDVTANEVQAKMTMANVAKRNLDD